ncbi:hypothetical protein D4R86_02310 [bacterium]|nr:MAG: hypothetical protein D4R86_02310 [bacterium]
MNAIDKFRNRPSKWIKVDTKEVKLLLTINGYRWEGWQSVIELKNFIIFEIRNQFISWQLRKEQDPEGKWTMNLVIEIENKKKERIKNLIEKKAREMNPSVKVNFEEV